MTEYCLDKLGTNSNLVLVNAIADALLIVLGMILLMIFIWKWTKNGVS